MARDHAGAVSLIVPGSIETLTGGYLYDRRILAELASVGWDTAVLSLQESFPAPTEAALADAARQFGELAQDRLVVIDGLALAGLLPLLPTLLEQRRCAALIHHPLSDETGLDPTLASSLAEAETAALQQMPLVIVTSPWTRQRLTAAGLAPERIAVVEPGSDRGTRGRRASADRLRLLSVATVTPRKGHAVLIAALARLADRDWSLRCVGSLDRDRDCVRELQQQISRLGLSQRVELLGELAPESLQQEFAAADLFVLPSYLEGFGMAFAEAIANGLPVVGTRAGAIPDTVPAEAGRLVTPGDADELTVVLAALFDDRSALDALAAAARRAAGRLRSWATAGREIDAALRRLVQ